MKKLKNILIFTVIVAFVFALTNLLDSENETNNKNFEQVEYFKNSKNERIFCIYTPETNRDKIYDWASANLMHTDGAITDAFFYHNKNEIPKIATAVNSELVYLNTMDSKYFARFYINYKNEKTLKLK